MGLGAMTEDGRVTPRGRVIAGVPVDPRLARALIDGAGLVGAERASEVVAMLSDFGLRDQYVAAMKGVVLAAVPDAQIVDITHDVTPGDVVEGAWLLAAACRARPPGTVVVADVDPGVGSTRRPIGSRSSLDDTSGRRIENSRATSAGSPASPRTGRAAGRARLARPGGAGVRKGPDRTSAQRKRLLLQDSRRWHALCFGGAQERGRRGRACPRRRGGPRRNQPGPLHDLRRHQSPREQHLNRVRRRGERHRRGLCVRMAPLSGRDARRPPVGPIPHPSPQAHRRMEVHRTCAQGGWNRPVPPGGDAPDRETRLRPRDTRDPVRPVDRERKLTG